MRVGPRDGVGVRTGGAREDVVVVAATTAAGCDYLKEGAIQRTEPHDDDTDDNDDDDYNN